MLPGHSQLVLAVAYMTSGQANCVGLATADSNGCTLLTCKGFRQLPGPSVTLSWLPWRQGTTHLRPAFEQVCVCLQVLHMILGLERLDRIMLFMEEIATMPTARLSELSVLLH